MNQTLWFFVLFFIVDFTLTVIAAESMNYGIWFLIVMVLIPVLSLFIVVALILITHYMFKR